LDAVNNAKTVEEYELLLLRLYSWRDGVSCAGGEVDMIGADLYYILQGIDRPMSGGVWLDWKPCL